MIEEIKTEVPELIIDGKEIDRSRQLIIKKTGKIVKFKCRVCSTHSYCLLDDFNSMAYGKLYWIYTHPYTPHKTRREIGDTLVAKRQKEEKQQKKYDAEANKSEYYKITYKK